MKKLKFVMVFGAIALIIFFFSFGSIVSGLVKIGIETGAPVVTGTTVTLESAKINPFSGSAYLNNMVVGNPEGYKTDSAFKMGKIGMDVDVMSLVSGDVIRIADITVDGAEITFEIGRGGANLLVIQKHAESLAASEESAKPADKTDKPAEKTEEKPAEKAEPADDKKAPAEATEGPGKKLVITRIIFKNAKVRLSAPFLNGKSYVQPMPDIIVDNLGADEGGTTPAQVMKQVFKQIIPIIIKTAKENKDLPGEMFKQLGEKFKSDEFKEAVKSVDTTKIKEVGKQIGGKIKGLFSK